MQVLVSVLLALTPHCIAALCHRNLRPCSNFQTGPSGGRPVCLCVLCVCVCVHVDVDAPVFLQACGSAMLPQAERDNLSGRRCLAGCLHTCLLSPCLLVCLFCTTKRCLALHDGLQSCCVWRGERFSLHRPVRICAFGLRVRAALVVLAVRMCLSACAPMCSNDQVARHLPTRASAGGRLEFGTTLPRSLQHGMGCRSRGELTG